MKNIAYKDFKDMVKGKANYGLETDILRSQIFNWFEKYPNQREDVLFTDIEEVIPLEIVPFFNKFGFIFDKQLAVMQTERTDYLMIIEPKPNKTLLEVAEEFIEANFPKGVTPDWVLIKKDYKTLKEVYEDLAEINSVYPEAYLYSSYTKLKEIAYNAQSLQDEINPYIKCGLYEIVRVEDEINNLAKRMDNDSNIRHKYFVETGEVLYKKCLESVKDKGFTKTPLLLYTGNNMHLFINVATHMLYHYSYNKQTPEYRNISAFIPVISLEYFKTRFANLNFDRVCMEVKDQVEFLLNFPALTVRGSEFDTFLFLQNRANLEVTADIYQIPLDDIKNSEPVLKNVNFKQIFNKMYNVSDYVDFQDLHSHDSKTILACQKELLQKYVEFENRIDLKDKLLSLDNTFIYVNGETTYLNYVHKLYFKSKGSLIALYDNKAIEYELKLEDINAFFPHHLFKFNKAQMEFINKVAKQMKIKNLQITMPVDPKQPHLTKRFMSKNAAPLKWHWRKDNNIITGLEWEDFMDLGMYWGELRVFKLGCLADFLKIFPRHVLRQDVSTTRITPTISVFGGVHPITSASGNLYVTDTMFRGAKTFE